MKLYHQCSISYESGAAVWGEKKEDGRRKNEGEKVLEKAQLPFFDNNANKLLLFLHQGKNLAIVARRVKR